MTVKSLAAISTVKRNKNASVSPLSICNHKMGAVKANEILKQKERKHKEIMTDLLQ